MIKKIIFITWTRADYWKIKSLINILIKDKNFEVYIFATWMHMHKKYWKTINEIYKNWYKNIFPFFNNYTENSDMGIVLANTIIWLSSYVHDITPDLIIVHGDRWEALAWAIVWSFNNILVWHIEWWEESWTIDESIRHSVSKLSHIHFVSNDEARKNLIQMWEDYNNIFIIWSPDLDIMDKAINYDINFIKNKYGIFFENYSIAIFHPVTTEYDNFHIYSKNFVDALLESWEKFIVIYPNSDKWSEYIFLEYKRLENSKNMLLFPSIRFEYFLALLYNSNYIIWNSSSWIKEAPYYWIKSIDIWTRQSNRYDKNHTTIIHSWYEKKRYTKFYFKNKK